MSAITAPLINGYCSFFIPPDGSKEGWEDSNDMDVKRERFINFLKMSSDSDIFCDWVCVMFGDEGGSRANIEDDSNNHGDEDSEKCELCGRHI